jgi:hypothetical protein
MVPRSPFKPNNASSRQKELQKTMCVPDEKRLNLGKLYEFAEREVASKKKGDVVLYVRTAKGSFLGEDTFKASTRPKKISTAKVAEQEAVEWFDNSFKPMLNRSSMYSAEVQQALADIVYLVATHHRVVLSDPKFLSLLKVVVEATPIAPERKCPAIPMAVQQPSAGVPDIPPPIVTTKQPAEEANPQVVALTTTMNRLLTQMEKNGQQQLELRDDHGDLVAVASVIRNDDAMRLLLCIDEPVAGEWAGPGSQGVSVHAGRQVLNWHGKGPKSEAQDERVARFLKWAQGFDAQILTGPKAQPVTMQAKSSEAPNTGNALAQQLALVYDDMLKSNKHWESLLDEKGQQVARVYLDHGQMPPRIVVTAPQGIDSTAPQKMEIAMDMVNKEVYFLEPSNAKPDHFDPWLKLVKGYEFSTAPTSAVRTVLQNDKPTAQAVTPAALTAALHSLSKAMSLNHAINDADRHRIWLDKKGNVRFDEVIGAELVASAEFVTNSDGHRILTVQSAFAHEQWGKKGLWGSVLSPNNGTNPSGLRLNTKADYESEFNASEIQTKVDGLMEFTQKFQNTLDALAKVQNAI